MQCSQCLYKKYGKIPPTPRRHASLFIVGEAPGAQELSQKRPFVGPSEQLLDKMLASIKVARDDVFITNALLCKPPSNGKTISKEAIMCCRARLLEELQEVQPQVVLALGNIAMHSLTGNFGLKITQEQGRVIQLNTGTATVPMVPCLHPAAVLRAPGNFKLFYGAFAYAGQLLTGGKILDPGKTTYAVIDNDSDLVEAEREIRKSASEGHIQGADIETNGLLFYRHNAIDLGISPRKNFAFIFPEHMIPKCTPILSDPDVEYCWHNGSFDTGMLWYAGIPAQRQHDSLVMHYCHNESEGGHDLKTLSGILLGASDYEKIVKSYTKPGDEGYESVPKEILWPYLACDCDYSKQIGDLLLPGIEEDEDLDKLYYDLLMPAENFLTRMSMNGLCTDAVALARLSEFLQGRLDEEVGSILDYVQTMWDPERYKKDTAHKTAPPIFNPGSPEQLKWMLFTRMGMKYPKRGKKMSTDAEILDMIKHQHPVIPHILDMRSIAKEKGTYVDGIIKRKDEVNRVHSSFGTTRTVTGRLSSRKPNVQNIKRRKEIKDIFVAGPGMRLLELDYRAAELRWLAELSQDTWLLSVFIEGRDLHTEVAIDQYGPNYTEDQRVRAKAVNFGIAYGRKPPSLAEEFNITLAEATRMVDRWFERAPQAHQYLLACDRAAEKGEVLTTYTGRKRRFGLITDSNLDELKNEARNFRIQSLSSDSTLFAAMEMEPLILSLGAKIVNLVHDSIVVEVPDDDRVAMQVAYAVSECMKGMPAKKFKATVPFEVEVKWGYAWGSLEKVKVEKVV